MCVAQVIATARVGSIVKPNFIGSLRSALDAKTLQESVYDYV